jgi:hypothetical protein
VASLGADAAVGHAAIELSASIRQDRRMTIRAGFLLCRLPPGDYAAA